MPESRNLEPVDIAVIGAGMAGLSAAVHARQAGLSVRVFERHFLPGGLCTAWKRKGFLFDYCIEYFYGSAEGHGFYPMWKDLGVVDGRTFLRITSFGRYEGTDGRFFELYTDPDRLQRHMLELAPEDAARIRFFCSAIRKAGRMVMTDLSLSPSELPNFIRSIPALPTAMRLSGVSMRGWCEGLKNPFLREALPELIGPVDFPMIGPVMVFGLMHRGLIGYPAGGSLPLARAVESRVTALGGEISYRSGVRRVLVENGKAVGVELEDGRVQRARQVVAACDARKTFDILLEGRVRDAAYEAMFRKREVNVSIVQVSLGVRLDPSWNLNAETYKLNLPLSRPFGFEGRLERRLTLYHYIRDPSMAPEGRTVMVIRLTSDYDHWKALREKPESYKAEKRRVLSDVVAALEDRFPGIGSRVEADDVATPVTCEDYTDNFRGCTQGWLITTGIMKDTMRGWKLPKRFPGLDRFHLIGQWSSPGGGLPPAAKDGRDVVRFIRKEMGR